MNGIVSNKKENEMLEINNKYAHKFGAAWTARMYAKMLKIKGKKWTHSEYQAPSDFMLTPDEHLYLCLLLANEKIGFSRMEFNHLTPKYVINKFRREAQDLLDSIKVVRGGKYTQFKGDSNECHNHI